MGACKRFQDKRKKFFSLSKNTKDAITGNSWISGVGWPDILFERAGAAGYPVRSIYT